MADSNTWVVTPEGLKSGDTLRDDYLKDTSITCPYCTDVLHPVPQQGWDCTYPWNGGIDYDCEEEAIYVCQACAHATCQTHIQKLI